MGARQSKRSCDITTAKEAVVAEGGEVAASGGEGKLERIEDLDVLKPQLNGDAAHQDVEISDKEKKMQQQDDAPENEKDNCNEKDIILSPVPAVNGDSNESNKETPETVEAETNKKNKKEKVKKKWSFRSISFSKKDKQKPAKKEETNGECEKVPEEVADTPAPVAEETKAEAAVVAEAPKVEEAEKAVETPVTEPITNGDSAPESPKEEIRQNGESAPVESAPAPAPVEAKEVSEPPKPVEAPESLPIENLKIEETAEVVAESKTEEVATPEKEPEAKSPEPAETEVCVVKAENVTTEATDTVPPPLPANPPPSSLTIFAESTMAPHLVNQQVVSDLPVVDVDASISSDLSSNPVTNLAENLQNVVPEAQPVCEIKPIDNAPLALPKEEVMVVDSQSVETANAAVSNDATNTPLENTTTSDVAVVPSNESELPKPDLPLSDQPAEKEPVVESPIESSLPVTDNVPVPELDNAPVSEVCVSKAAADSQAVAPAPLESEVLPSEIPVSNVSEEKPLEVPTNLEVTQCANVDILPDVNTSESPVPQGTPTDPDISETGFAEPSDSFPPPPPPVSCPESITEISASESLPPPLSESSQPDNALNSPTSETLDFPPKELPSPIKENGDVKDSIEPEASQTKLLNGDHKESPTETTVPPPPEVAPETTPAKAAESSAEESKKVASTDVSQVKTVSDVVENSIVDTVVDSIPAENCVVAAE